MFFINISYAESNFEDKNSDIVNHFSPPSRRLSDN